MITIPVLIAGVPMNACDDTGAAANVCTREEAYKVYMQGDAIFQEGARELLSLTAFGGSKVELEETFSAARVDAFGATFDQLFFIVDNDSQHLLLGLPALVQSKLRLLTPDGTNLMPEMTKLWNLDVDSERDAAQMKLTTQLNPTAVKLRTEWNKSPVHDFDPYRNLQFSQFGPARVGTIVPKAKAIENIDSDDEADCIELPEVTDGSSSESDNELGDKPMVKNKPVAQVFDQNMYWRSSPKVVGPVQFSTVTDGDTQDVRFQQSFQETRKEKPRKSEWNEQMPSAFQDKVPLQEEKPKTEPKKARVHWLTVKKGKYIQSQQRTYLKCNFLQAHFKLQQQLLVSGKLESKVTALDMLVEVAPNKCQWLVVENCSAETVQKFLF